METVGQRIKALRKEHGIKTQADLAVLADVSIQSIKRYESNAGIPSDDRSNGTLDKICSVFGVLPEWLLTGNGKRNSVEGLKEYINKYVLSQEVWEKIKNIYDIENIPPVSDDLYNKLHNGKEEELSKKDLLELLAQSEAQEALKNDIFNCIEIRTEQFKKKHKG